MACFDRCRTRLFSSSFHHPRVSFDLHPAKKVGFYLYYLVYGIFNYPSGHWADRYGRKRMIFLFLLILSIAIFLMALSHSFWQLLLFCGLAGLGGGGSILKGGDVQIQSREMSCDMGSLTTHE